MGGKDKLTSGIESGADEQKTSPAADIPDPAAELTQIFNAPADLTSLPDGLTVTGDLILDKSALKPLPKGMIDDSKFFSATPLKTLPKELIDDGTFDLGTPLKKLPKELIEDAQGG